MLPMDGHLLRILVGEKEKHEGVPLYEWIVRKAREQGLAGATVIRGIQGFGAGTRMQSAKILRLSMDLPVVIEIVDARDRIEEFLPVIDRVVKEGLVTVEDVKVKVYREND